MKTQNRPAITQINIGATAPNFISAIANSNPQLKCVSFRLYSPEPGVHERLRILETKSTADIINNFLHHDNRSNKHWQVFINDLTVEAISARIANVPNDLALALESKCMFQDASVKYIPMMDFNAPHSAENLKLLTEFLIGLHRKGIIVDSGASYHFYGFDFLDQVGWIKFMGECLLIPWSDSRWVGHSLIAGGGDLRISATAQKPKVPSVCEILR